MLKIAVNDLTNFNYIIRLNGIWFDDIPGLKIDRDDKGNITSMEVLNRELARSYAGVTSSTDCGGKYTLIN